MNKLTSIIIGIISIIIVGIFLITSNRATPQQATDILNKKGIVYYYSPDCPHCQSEEQYIILDQLINKVNVDPNPGNGIVEFGNYTNLKGTPAFDYNGEFYYGELTSQEIKNKYG